MMKLEESSQDDAADHLACGDFYDDELPGSFANYTRSEKTG